MKNNIRSKKIIGIILVAILVLTANVYAANDSFKTTLGVDNSQAKRGQSITVTMALSDIAIESGEKGIGAYTASIDFDSSVLEYVSTNGTDKWEEPFYQDELIAGNTNDGKVINTAQNIGTITFKVKDDAKLGDTIIKLTNFSGSTASTDVAANDSSVKITIVDKDGGSGNGNANGNTNVGGSQNGSANSNTQNGGNSNSSNKLNGSNTNKEDIKQGVLPKAGDSNIVVCVLIGVCALVAISLLVRIKLLDKKIE